MRRSRMRYSRRPPQQLRLGRDFAFAIFLLTLGVAFPLSAAIVERRAATQTIASAAPAPVEHLVVPASPAPLAATPPLLAGPVADAGSVAGPPPIAPTLIPIPPTPPAGVGLQLAPLAQPAPILMYHYVRTVDASLDPLGFQLSVTPELFDQHMAWLAQNGYTGIRLDTMLRCMRGEPLCPPQPVVLTFDDGYADAYDAAFPILQRYGFSATFYIVTGFVGQPGYMGWEQVAALRDSGMEIGSHTIDHLMLTQTDPVEMARQITQSKQDLEHLLGVPITSFCYPVGDLNGFVVEQVRAAGYANAVTTRWDNNYSDPLTLPRRRVEGGKTPEELGWIVMN
jgi:peptidoglycan/xylan/chitin deacetylase (PgdA/CDA1 family)